MALVMNDTDMKRMLEELCPEGETYTAMAWGTIMAGTAEVLALGALSNIYCYIGIINTIYRLLNRCYRNFRCNTFYIRCGNIENYSI